MPNICCLRDSEALGTVSQFTKTPHLSCGLGEWVCALVDIEVVGDEEYLVDLLGLGVFVIFEHLELILEFLLLLGLGLLTVGEYPHALW